MKVLFVGFSHNSNLPIEADFKTLDDASPYGYDYIVVDPSTLSTVTGGNGIAKTIIRWHHDLQRWKSPQHKIIVMQRPYEPHGDLHNYSWLGAKGIISQYFQPSGTDAFLGDIVAKRSFIKNYLTDFSADYHVSSYYKPTSVSEGFEPNSLVTANVYSSFIWSDENSFEIIFIPPSTAPAIAHLIQAIGHGLSNWKLPQTVDIEEKISDIEHQVIKLEAQKRTHEESLLAVSNNINYLLETDIYLQRAVSSYTQVSGTENPNPEKYYEAIESIENAFSSEREMQESLTVSKSFVNKVMRRANEFRHVAKSGDSPQPLTQEEKTEFDTKIEQIIKKYINYLYDKHIAVSK